MQKHQTEEYEGLLKKSRVTDSYFLVQITLRYTLFYLTTRSLLHSDPFFHSCTVYLDIIKVFFYFHQRMHYIFV
jgi:hypothetical protein